MRPGCMLGFLVYGGEGLAARKLCQTLLSVATVRGPQSLPLNNTMGGGAGLRPEGRNTDAYALQKERKIDRD